MSTVKLTLELQPEVALQVLNLIAQSPSPIQPIAPPAVPAVPVQSPVQSAPVAPPVQYQQPAAPVQQAAPTAPPQAFTLDQLAVAATSLMDAGKQQDLMGLLAKFGVQALTQLNKDYYGAFATELRQLGARI